MGQGLSSSLSPFCFNRSDPKPDTVLSLLQTSTDIPKMETAASTPPPMPTPLVITTTVTIGRNVTTLEVRGDLKGLETKAPGQWWRQLMRMSGANLGLSSCPQGGLDPDSGTELGTLETDLAREDEEGGGPTMGPDFRAAEQSSRAQFQIFPVSLGGWVRPRGPHVVVFPLLPSFLSCLECLPTTPTQSTDIYRQTLRCDRHCANIRLSGWGDSLFNI